MTNTTDSSATVKENAPTLRLVWPQWQGASVEAVRKSFSEVPFEEARRGYAVGAAVLGAVLPAHTGPTALVPVESGDLGLSKQDGIEAKEEVTRGSRKLKPITPPLKGKGLHTLLFLMRPFPHGVLDTSAESIPNFETKNKVLTHFLAMLTQFSARFRCETWIRGRNSVTF